MSGGVNTNEMVLHIFRQIGALREGHYQLTSGRHTDRVIKPVHLFEHPQYAVLVTAIVAGQFSGAGVTLVAGFSPESARFGYELARQLGARAIFFDREADKPVLRREFAIKAGDRVILAGETIASGGDFKAVSGIVGQAGANLTGIAAVIDRTGGHISFGIPLRSAVSVDVPAWEPAACPLCKAKTPLINTSVRRIR